jgi:putative sterol carrier protein
MSEVAEVFETLQRWFQPGVVLTPHTYYFSLDGDDKWTVRLTRDACTVEKGKLADEADVFFKSSTQMFLDVWNGRYVPSAKDFLLGTIKSNNPMALKDFIAAFKKKG